MSDRKVIQVSQASAVYGYTLIALCDDGTMWWKSCVKNFTWDQITPVPQPLPIADAALGESS